MGLLDDLKDDIKKAAEEARLAALEHRHEMDRGIESAAEVVDSKTSGKHTARIRKAADAAHTVVSKLERPD